jgi:hypothetical protein
MMKMCGVWWRISSFPENYENHFLKTGRKLKEMETIFVFNLLQYVLDIKRKSKNKKKRTILTFPGLFGHTHRKNDYFVKDSVLWQKQLRRA